MTWVIVLAVALAVGLLRVRTLVWPPAPDLVAELDHWRLGREKAARRADQPVPTSVLEKVTRWVDEGLRARRPELIESLVPDLAITGRDLHGWLSRVVTLSVAFAVVPLLLLGARRVNGGGVPIQWAPLIAVAMVVLVWVLSVRDLRAEARLKRQQFTRALSLYLDLVAMSMESGLGHAQALPSVAQIGAGHAFDEIRSTIELAPSKGITPWTALGQLGERYRISELVSLRSSLELAQDDGARIKDTLTARAETMRSARLAAEVERATKATESMRHLTYVAAFLVTAYLTAPIILALRTAAGTP